MSDVIHAEKVTVGGLAVKLDPASFERLVQDGKTIIHGLKSYRPFFRKKYFHIYLAVSGGLTFYTKVSEPLSHVPVHIETDWLFSYIKL